MAAIPKTIGCASDWCEHGPLLTPQQVHLPRAPTQDAVTPTPLQLNASDTKVLPATPVKRRGKSMSSRTGQSGHIESSGKWWVVRWWMDVPGLERRRHMRQRICPISGPGSLSKSGRERLAREIISESGADTVEYFNQVVKQKACVTFYEQPQWWLNHVTSL